MPEQFGEKTHEATPHRRQQAREQGQVPKSQDLASAVLLLAALTGLLFLGKSLVQFMHDYASSQLTNVWTTVDSGSVILLWNKALWGMARYVLPILALLVVVAILIQFVQIGFLFLPKLIFDPGRINPIKGVKRIFSLSNVVRLALGVFKIIIVTTVAVASVTADLDTIVSLATLSLPLVATTIADITIWTCIKVGSALLILALADYAFQRWKHEQDMRMSHQEIREELKTLQGDPQVIARRRAVQRQLILNRLNTAVPGADVVVTNPTELAIAIKYEHEQMEAPLVVAKGAGLIAQRIRKLALENNIPVVERKSLAQALFKQVDVGKPIPPAQYAAVAEVLRYVYQLQGRTIEAANT